MKLVYIVIAVALFSCVLADTDYFMGKVQPTTPNHPLRALALGSNQNIMNQKCVTDLSNTKAIQLIG